MVAKRAPAQKVMKKRAPKKATKSKIIKSTGPTQKIVRIQLDLAMEGDAPFDMPVVHPHDLATSVALFVMQRIKEKDENGLYLMPGAKLRISMMDNPPKGMKRHG